MKPPTIFETMAEAIADIPNGASLMIPGFGPGTPWNLMAALYEQGARDLVTISNGIGFGSDDDILKDAGSFISQKRVKAVTAAFTASTHPSRVSAGEQAIRNGELHAEIVPQGTLAERIRAGGAGIPAFFTPAGVGTQVAEGKEIREFDGREYLLETALTADYTFVRAWKADRAGNLVYRRAARELQPDHGDGCSHHDCGGRGADCRGRRTRSRRDPYAWDLRGTAGSDSSRRHIQREFRAATDATRVTGKEGTDQLMATKQPLNRDQMAAVLAQHLGAGWNVNLGIGIPTLASSFIDPSMEITLSSENGVIGYGPLAGEGEEDFDVVNAGIQYVTLTPGAAIVHHADSFALIRGGRLDCTVLGAYEVAADGSFANWKTMNEPANGLGGIGGAMDLAASAKQVYIAMQHTTREGTPRLVERCSLPLTAPSGVTLVVTDIAVVRVSQGEFVLEQCAPGYTIAEIEALTAGPLRVSPDVREMTL